MVSNSRFAKGIYVRLGVLFFVFSAVAAALSPRQEHTKTGTTTVIRVTDESGATVPGAQVRVVPLPENLPEKMETNEKGEIVLSLRPSGYGLAVQMPGFKNYSGHIEVKEVGEPQVFPVVLHVAIYSGPVVVEAPRDELRVSVYPFDETFWVKKEDLKLLHRVTIKEHNAHSNADEKYEGVALAELLTKYGAPLGKDLHDGALAMCVVATGSDGYKAVFSLAEIDASFHPGDVIVADTLDGKPLDNHSGPLKLVVSEDKRPAREVRNLTALGVKPVW